MMNHSRELHCEIKKNHLEGEIMIVGVLGNKTKKVKTIRFEIPEMILEVLSLEFKKLFSAHYQ